VILFKTALFTQGRFLFCILTFMAYVYILASARNGTLYVGVTNDLIARVYQHKNDFVDSFTSRHKVNQLVWFEQVDSILSAIQREKQIKAWKREWKIRLIEESNPYWRDLYLDIV
jgi:putative endonuclease